MIVSVLRLLIAGWILFTLARAARGAYQQRRLVLLIWSRIRPWHLLGTIALAALVLTVANLLINHVAFMDAGFGNLLGSSSNAVFTPLEEAVAATGPPPAQGPDWSVILLSSLFLGPLLLLLPWLAFVEEEVFRGGLENEPLLIEVGAALVFGLVHMIVLVPLGAGLAVGVSGFVYGRIYRSAYNKSDGVHVPASALRSYRPTGRSQRAARRDRTPEGALRMAGAVGLADHTPERRQAAGVLASAVWHTTFNSLIVSAVWIAIVVDAWSR